MVDKPQPEVAPQAAVPGSTPVAGAPRRPPGHRGTDMRDSVAELAERAQLISQEAGTKVAAAMRDVISAAAGIAGFAIESARDLVQYMVKRGQMTPEEADKLIREAEAAHDKRPASEKSRPTATKVAAEKAAIAKAEAAARAAALAQAAPPFRHVPRPAPPPAPSPAPARTEKTAAPSPPAKPAKAASKTASKSAPAKLKPASAPPKSAKTPSKSAAKPAKPAAKKGGKR